jgi:CubicO group peptidase (beta-lactamase class C family)
MRRKLPVLALALLLVVSSTASALAAEAEPPASPEVAAAMQPYLEHYKLAGVVAIIADRGGRVHYRNLIGYADVEAKRPISEDNVFWVASMSKMFVGASVMETWDRHEWHFPKPQLVAAPCLASRSRATARGTVSRAIGLARRFTARGS